MNVLNRLYSWYGKKTVLITIAVIVGLIVAGIVFKLFTSAPQTEVTQTELITAVHVSRADLLSSDSLFRVIGEVKAVSEARLQTESSGRITSVAVELGDTVRAGAILASLENSAQRASLLQAEGAYDAAQASAVSSESSTQSAQTTLDASLTSAVNSYKSAYISVDSSVRNTIDDLFSNPTGTLPGFRLEAYGQAPALNDERVALEDILDSWSSEVNTTNTSNVEVRLAHSLGDVERIAQFAETLAGIVARQDTSASFTQEQKDALEAELLGVRSTLNQTDQSLQTELTSIENARESLQRAQIAGSGSEVSLSQAQLKSALGSLRAAQSAYEKTIVRTPISGVVNALYLKEGEYTTAGSPAAIVANNAALEISTSLSAEDADLVNIGQEVTIDDTVTGVVTAIAPAIDPLTNKKEIKIGVDADTTLENGSTVSIQFARTKETTNTPLTLPLSALKITTEGALAFSVQDDNTLKSHAVKLGKIMGDVVEIESGLAADTIIVVDARGLREGEVVEVIQE